ncbi:MAG: prephenate dehydrogenase [Clostridia bacterium]|nr:prephenate dehydrogenase [Clostridia bacterium]
MKLLNTQNVLIVGLGLMGGSYAKALRRLDFHICAIDKDPDSIEYALGAKIIDEGSTEPDKELIGKADIIVFALYPMLIKEWISEYQQYFKSGAVITDVTGVKSCIVYDIQEILRDDVEFIAAHPMAGREVYGVRNSTEKMFRDANFLVVPTDKNTQQAVEWCKELGRLLGIINVTVLSPEEHDKMIGFVSQLTHCIAVALMTCSDNTHLADYTADSFRDLTRIANINEVMWSELFLLNKEPLLADIDRFISEMTVLRNMLESGDREGLKAKMRLSTQRRAAFNKV